MYTDNNLKEKIKEVRDFTNVLLKFVVTTNQININESLVNVYNKYDNELRSLFVDLIKCETLPKEGYQKCIKTFKNNYDELRSRISQIIEKDLSSNFKII
jgi:hypothetical protein